LRYLGRHRRDLNRHVENEPSLHACDARVVDWLDFDFAGNWTLDGECRQVDFLAENDPARRQWPSVLNPSWDAIGVLSLRYPSRFQNEWLLVEAKAHTAELRCDPKTAGGQSKDAIRQLLHQTRDRIDPANQADWLCDAYQLANRLFTLDHLILHGVPARLLLLYFCGDQSSGGGSICPASAEQWAPSIQQMYEQLGLSKGLGPLADRVHKVFVPVSPVRGTYPLQRDFNWPSPRPPRRRPLPALSEIPEGV
jgi:hypothetical protein